MSLVQMLLGLAFFRFRFRAEFTLSISLLAHALVVLSIHTTAAAQSARSADSEPPPWPGDVDLSFDANLTPNSYVTATASLGDGRWLIGGNFTGINGGLRRHVARLNANGTVDHSFAAMPNSRVETLAVQDDGRIIIGGIFTAVEGATRNRIARLNPNGTLDTSFGHGLAGVDGTVTAIALQDDGKILIGGEFTSVNDTPRSFIARLDAFGNLDTAFGNDLDIPYGLVVEAIGVQSDGKIVIGGRFSIQINERWVHNLVRLNADGSIDESFYTGGWGPDNRVNSIVIQEDDKILVGGRFGSIRNANRNRIARLLPNGELDRPFGEWLSGADSPFGVFEIAVQHDGKILIVGAFETVHGEPRRGIARLHPNGSLDEDFGEGAAGAEEGWVWSVAVQDDDSILIGGSFQRVNDLPRSRVALLHGGDPPNLPPTDIAISNQSVGENHPAGTPVGLFTATDPDEDDTHIFDLVSGEGDEGNQFFYVDGNTLRTAYVFNYEARGNYTIRVRATDTGGLFVEKAFGIVVHPSPPPGAITSPWNFDYGWETGFAINGAVRVFQRQADGKWIIGGTFTEVDGTPRSGIARLNSDGSLDHSFEDGLNGAFGAVYSLVLQEDGRVLVGAHEGIARLHPDGTLDNDFFPSIYGSSKAVYSIAIQNDGRILIGGNFREFVMVTHVAIRNRIARLHPDGLLDTSFGTGLTGANAPVLAVDIQSDGRILVGGVFSQINSETRTRVARLNTDGSLDEEFHGPVGSGIINHLESRPEGRLLIAGRLSLIDDLNHTGLARLNANGTLDQTFNADVFQEEGEVHSFVVQNDGRIIIAGNFLDIGGVPRGRVARLHTDGSVDLAFMNHAAGASDTVYTVDLTDDIVLIGGAFTAVNHIARHRIARIIESDEFSLFEIWATPLPGDQRAPDDDPGGFGIPNVLRYAFGMDPLQPDRDRLPRLGMFANTLDPESPEALSESGADGGYLTLTYTRRTDDPALLYFVEVSGNLHEWLPFEGVEEVTDDANGETETVSVTDIEPMEANGKRFLRVRVEW